MRVIVSGGVIRRGERSLIGDIAFYTYQGIYADKLFLGTGGLDAKAGLTDHNLQEGYVKREMIKSAKKVIALVDSSKFNTIALSTYCSLEELDCLVSEKMPEGPLLDALKKANVELLIAESGVLEK